MGTLLEIAGDSLTMVATDGYRLAKWRRTLVAGIDAEGTAKYIVPSRALAEAARNLGGAETIEVGALGPSGNQLAFAAANASIVVRLVDGQYPNYAQVIPRKFDRSVTVNTSALIGGLRRAELVAGDRASMVKMAVSSAQLDHHRELRHDGQRLRRTRGRADGRRSHDRLQRALSRRDSQPHRLRRRS